MLSFGSADRCRFYCPVAMSGSSECVINAHAPMITLTAQPGSLHAIAAGR